MRHQAKRRIVHSADRAPSESGPFCPFAVIEVRSWRATGEVSEDFSGRRTRDRTWDLGLVRAALFQLSYPPEPNLPRGYETSLPQPPPNAPENAPESRWPAPSYVALRSSYYSS